MDFWNHKVNVSKEAAQMQIDIVSQFSPEKRMNIALEFANMGVVRTREWIKENHPTFSDLEVSLEFVRLMYVETGEMSEKQWGFYRSRMQAKIRKHWAKRFRQMMRDNDWSYEDVAKLGDFKSGKVIEATISRGLPSFAKLAVMIHESSKRVKSP